MTHQVASATGEVASSVPTAGAPAFPSPFVDALHPTRAARAIGLVLAAGLIAQLLVVNQAGGINVLVWVTFVLAATVAVRRPGARIDRFDVWLPAAALLFAGFIALRDEAMLFMFNLPMAGALTLASVVALGGTPLTRMSARRVMRAGGVAVLLAGLGGAALAPGARSVRERVVPSANPRLAAVVRGTLVALPLLFVFFVLFRAADPIFAELSANVFRLDVHAGQLPARLIVALLAGWLFAGTMAAAWMARREAAAAPNSGAANAAAGKGAIEAFVVLVLIDALFVVFVAIQAAYLFGGLDTIAAAGMTYADYARRGFFELVVVATIVGVVLLVVGRRVEGSAAVRVASIALALLTGFTLVSAALRLDLYQSAYGWSELRIYVLAAIAWLGACLVATLAALSVARTGWLLHAWLAAGLMVAILVNVIGPQQLATAANVARAVDPSLVAEGGRHGLDMDYISWFGADAVPVLIAARDRLPPDDARAVERALRSWAVDLRAQAHGVGWPSWNLSRAIALEQLRAAGY